MDEVEYYFLFGLVRIKVTKVSMEREALQMMTKEELIKFRAQCYNDAHAYYIQSTDASLLDREREHYTRRVRIKLQLLIDVIDELETR